MQNPHISELESLQPTALDAGLVFSGNASGKLIQGYGKPSAYTPTVYPDYLFHEAGRDIVVWLMNPAESYPSWPLRFPMPQPPTRLPV